jgi:hypothetical protein
MATGASCAACSAASCIACKRFAQCSCSCGYPVQILLHHNIHTALHSTRLGLSVFIIVSHGLNTGCLFLSRLLWKGVALHVLMRWGYGRGVVLICYLGHGVALDRVLCGCWGCCVMTVLEVELQGTLITGL